MISFHSQIRILQVVIVGFATIGTPSPSEATAGYYTWMQRGERAEKKLDWRAACDAFRLASRMAEGPAQKKDATNAANQTCPKVPIKPSPVPVPPAEAIELAKELVRLIAQQDDVILEDAEAERRAAIELQKNYRHLWDYPTKLASELQTRIANVVRINNAIKEGAAIRRDEIANKQKREATRHGTAFLSVGVIKIVPKTSSSEAEGGGFTLAFSGRHAFWTQASCANASCLGLELQGDVRLLKLLEDKGSADPDSIYGDHGYTGLLAVQGRLRATAWFTYLGVYGELDGFTGEYRGRGGEDDSPASVWRRGVGVATCFTCAHETGGEVLLRAGVFGSEETRLMWAAEFEVLNIMRRFVLRAAVSELEFPGRSRFIFLAELGVSEVW